MTSDRVMRLPEVLDLIRISRSRLYVWMRDGYFPKPIKLGPKAVGWRYSEVHAWLKDRERAQIG